MWAQSLSFLCTVLIFLRFVDRDMVIRYHWGHGVGHTYAFGGADVTEAPLVSAEIEEQATDFSKQAVRLPGKDEDDLDSRSLGEDDMVYQNDSDDNESDGDADDAYDEIYG